MISRIYYGRNDSSLKSLKWVPAVALLGLLLSPSPAHAQATSAPGGISIYPKNGQSPEQQSADRYECHSWAKSQTGYDPTVIGGGVAPGQSASVLQQYRRAMSACLDAKGYSTSVAAPAPSAAPPPSRVAVAAVPPDLGPQLKYHPFHFQIDGGYSIPAGESHQDLDGGAIGGLGFAWFPSASLPVGIRADGSYSHFDIKDSVLAQNGNYGWGHENIYGGDADLQLNLAHRSARSQMYLLGGVGWYREQTELRGVSWVNGTLCNWFFCFPATYPAVTSREDSTSAWMHSWNAGLGWETAISDYASFFVEARYERIKPYESHVSFVPVTVGFRF